jgi:hypothetical protein
METDVTSSSTLRSLLSLSAVTDAEPLEDIASNPISSRNGQPGVGEALGDEGRDTLLCFEEEILLPRRGNGAVNEKVEEGALSLLVEAWGSSVAMLNFKRRGQLLWRLPETRKESVKCQDIDARRQGGWRTTNVRRSSWRVAVGATDSVAAARLKSSSARLFGGKPTTLRLEAHAGRSQVR